MNLENNQSVHNLYSSVSRNMTPSNDPMQIKNDTTSMLIRGAEVALEGRSMGLDADQTLDVVLQRAQQNEVPNVEQRRSVQVGATNVADQSIFKEASKRKRG